MGHITSTENPHLLTYSCTG